MTEIFNLTKREKKFIPVPLDKSESVSDYEGEIDDDVSLPPQFIIDPFEENNNEEEIDPVEFKKIAYKIFSDSDEEYCVLDEMFKGHQTKQIAINLGISEIDVYNIKKRITRVLKAWFKRNSKPQRFSEPRRFSEPPRFSKNPLDKNKPGKSTPENNNNGELS
jgi:DNA-directed RNA polymerase specialized sigma subunit